MNYLDFNYDFEIRDRASKLNYVEIVITDQIFRNWDNEWRFQTLVGWANIVANDLCLVSAYNFVFRTLARVLAGVEFAFPVTALICRAQFRIGPLDLSLTRHIHPTVDPGVSMIRKFKPLFAHWRASWFFIRLKIGINLRKPIPQDRNIAGNRKILEIVAQILETLDLKSFPFQRWCLLNPGLQAIKYDY